MRGHAIVFSNHEPIEQLKHRDIIHINLNNNNNNNNQDNIILDINNNNNNNNQDNRTLDIETSEEDNNSDEEPYSPIKARILTYPNKTVYLEHPNQQHSKRFENIQQLGKYINKHRILNTLDEKSANMIIQT